MLHRILAPTVVAVCSFTGSAFAEAARPGDGLTKAEAAAGWKLYSGSDAASLWKGYRQPGFPKQGWKVADGMLSHPAGGNGGDILTIDQFSEFEMTCRFKLASKANSGIMWRASEKHDTAWQTGPEFQVYEDIGAGVKPDDAHSCGALYDLYPPMAGKVSKPAGEWNEAHIRLKDGVIQHWVNGAKTVEARIFDASGKPTPEWLAKIKASKFNVYEGFGVLPSGSIGLQDHGDEVAYADVKIRDLSKRAAKEVVLFDGTNLDAWDAFVPDLAAAGKDQKSVWSVKDGVLICAGNPGGYIHTKKDYTNYVLKLDWRFNPVTKKAGNSGVLLRMIGEHMVWPKSVEAQLQSGAAGDFWNIENFKMTAAPERTNGRNTKRTHGTERAVGEWNEYEIIVNKGDVVLMINGEEVNRAKDVEEVAGKICLQSEGAEIQFRNIRLVPLD